MPCVHAFDLRHLNHIFVLSNLSFVTIVFLKGKALYPGAIFHIFVLSNLSFMTIVSLKGKALYPGAISLFTYI